MAFGINSLDSILYTWRIPDLYSYVRIGYCHNTTPTRFMTLLLLTQTTSPPPPPPLLLLCVRIIPEASSNEYEYKYYLRKLFIHHYSTQLFYSYYKYGLKREGSWIMRNFINWREDEGNKDFRNVGSTANLHRVPSPGKLNPHYH
jgi:hypothetical protein